MFLSFLIFFLVILLCLVKRIFNRWLWFGYLWKILILVLRLKYVWLRESLMDWWWVFVMFIFWIMIVSGWMGWLGCFVRFVVDFFVVVGSLLNWNNWCVMFLYKVELMRLIMWLFVIYICFCWVVMLIKSKLF